jgi:hypothetical protein
MASAPASTAWAMSASRVKPQILTRVRMGATDALQSALAQTRTDFGGPATCSVAAEDLRVALHLIGQAALIPYAASAYMDRYAPACS